MEHISSLSNESVLHSFTSSSCLNGEEVAVCFCCLSFMWTVHLTDRRIAIRVVKKLFGFSFHERQESFRYKDLKHVSVAKNVTYWKFFFSAVSLSTIFAVVDAIRFLTNVESVFSHQDSVSAEEEEASSSGFSFFSNVSIWDGEIYEKAEPSYGETEIDSSYDGNPPEAAESSSGFFDSFVRAIKITLLIVIVVSVVQGLFLFVIAFVESFCFKSINLDFYKKERVESWHFFSAFNGRFGSATTRTLRFSPQQCHAIAKALHEHGKTQLLDDSLRSDRPPTAE